MGHMIDRNSGSHVVFLTAFVFYFQDAKTKWAQTLWVDLNTDLLQEGVEGYIKNLRRLPKHVKELAVAFFLEGQMKEFGNSLPLLLDLKNEALRDRSVFRLIPEATWNPPCFKTNAQISLHVKEPLLNEVEGNVDKQVVTYFFGLSSQTWFLETY